MFRARERIGWATVALAVRGVGGGRVCARRVLKARPAGEALRSPPVPSRRDDSADLFADPMPERIEPCLALAVPKPLEGPDWAFEVKWDGYRLAVHRYAKGVRILSRGGHDWTHRFPSIAAEAATLPSESFILDGEAVVLDEGGHASFGLLQQALGGRGGKRSAALKARSSMPSICSMSMVTTSRACRSTSADTCSRTCCTRTAIPSG